MPSLFEPLFQPLFTSATPAQPASDGPAWLGLLAARGGGDFAGDARFMAAAPEPQAPETLHLPEELDAAYADGMAAGRAALAAELAADDSARAGLAMALARLDTQLGETLADRLSQVVAALCEATMAPFAIDPASLQRRCVLAAAKVGEGIIDATLRLNPADIALLDPGFASTWHILPDPGLERGSVVFDMAEGVIEDGPAQWRAALAEALLQC